MKCFPATLGMLILRVLSLAPSHASDCPANPPALQRTAPGEEGSLYPALQRIALEGLGQAEWGISETKSQGAFLR